MVNWIVFCAFIASLGMTLMGLVVDLTYQLQYKPKLSRFQDIQSNKLESYLAEKSFFDKHPVFHQNPKNQRDFNNIFLPLMERYSSLVDIEAKKKALAYGDKWLEKRHLVDPNEQLDHIFSQVHNFQHWNLTADIVEKYQLSPSDFMVINQIYLSNAFYYSPKEVLVSLEQSRNLAKVLLSTEILNFKLAGLSLIEKEHQFINWLIQRKVTGFESWKLVPPETITRFRRFLNQTSEFLNYLTPKDVLDKAFLTASLPTGVCAILNDKQVVLQWAEPFLNQNFPFEPSFQSSLKVIDQVVDKTRQHCHTKIGNASTKTPFVVNMPYYRRLYALRVLLGMDSKQ